MAFYCLFFVSITLFYFSGVGDAYHNAALQVRCETRFVRKLYKVCKKEGEAYAVLRGLAKWTCRFEFSAPSAWSTLW